MKALLKETEFQVIPKNHLSNAVAAFVKKDDKDAIRQMVEHTVKKANKQILSRQNMTFSEDAIREATSAGARKGDDDNDGNESDKGGGATRPSRNDVSPSRSPSPTPQTKPNPTSSTSSRKRKIESSAAVRQPAKSQASSAASSRPTKRAKKPINTISSSDDDDDDDDDDAYNPGGDTTGSGKNPIVRHFSAPPFAPSSHISYSLRVVSDHRCVLPHTYRKILEMLFKLIKSCEIMGGGVAGH